MWTTKTRTKRDDLRKASMHAARWGRLKISEAGVHLWRVCKYGTVKVEMFRRGQTENSKIQKFKSLNFVVLLWWPTRYVEHNVTALGHNGGKYSKLAWM